MANNNIRIKRSSVAGKAPTTANISLGEIAINTYDGRIYIARDNGNASIVEFTQGITSSNTAPSSPTDNALWYDSDSGKTYIYYNDGTSSQWVLYADPTIDRGETGYTGSQGSIGYTGSQGDTGFVGSQGSLGATGYTGSQGTGFTGSKGDTGYDGSVGYSGSKGDIGYTGSKGDTGFSGSVGFSGSKGDIGFTGSKGDTGFTGSKGDTGFNGSVGFTGSKGDTGFTGSKGDTGFTGSKGDTGGAFAGGNDTEVQFNDGGTVIGGTTSLRYFKGNGVVLANSGVNSTSTTSGAIQVVGGIGITGNLQANAVYTDNLFYANGAPFSTGAGLADKILSGASNVTVTSNYVNVAIASSNVASFNSGGVSALGNVFLANSAGGTGARMVYNQTVQSIDFYFDV